jgi:hypothetical protein
MCKQPPFTGKHGNIAKSQPVHGFTLHEKNIARQDARKHAAASHSNLCSARQPQDVYEQLKAHNSALRQSH